MNIRFKGTDVNLNGKTILLYGEYSRIFPFLFSLIRMNKDSTLLFLDEFNTRTMLKGSSSFSFQELSKITLFKFESLVELDKALEQSETLLKKGSFGLLVAGSLPDAYLHEMSLHDPSSHSNILYLLNKILAFFSFLSKEYGCTSILIGPGEDLNGSINIPAKRIFLYWMDYVLELRRCGMDRTFGDLTAKNGSKNKICIPQGGFEESNEVLECNEDACPGNV